MTMIHINLLPVRREKKREMGRQMLVIAGFVVALSVLVNYVWYDHQSSQVDRNQRELDATQKQISEKEKVIGEVNDINKHKKEIDDKLKVLDDLRKGRSGPVRMMDALSLAMPKKVWLKDFTEIANAVNLRGSAFSHDDVAELMRGLDTVVWTPQGMGRLVDQKRDAKTARVELMSGDSPVVDMDLANVAHFFTDVTLKTATQTTDARPDSAIEKFVDFEITLRSNYAI